MSTKHVKQACFLALAVALYGCSEKSGNSRGIVSPVGKVVVRGEPIANTSKTPTIDMMVDEFGQVVTKPGRTELKPGYIAALTPSDEMSGILHKYDPSFQAWTIDDFPKAVVEFYPYSSNSLPYAVTGDFNDDNRTDLILSGHNATQNLILGIISGPIGYSVVPLWRESFYSKLSADRLVPPYTPTHTLCVQSIGRKFISGDMDAETITLKYEGVTVKQFAKFNSTTGIFTKVLGGLDLYEWNQDLGRFKAFYISDTGSTSAFNIKF